jgi:type IV fimbrial biogenesis protein FimT
MQNNRGFTLVEMMVTLAVLGIILGIAAPSMQSFIRNTRLASGSEELLMSLMMAQSEAIKRGSSVTVCNTANPTADSPSCSNSSDWRSGWLVFVDVNNDGVLDTGETVLKVGQPPKKIDSITAKSGLNDISLVRFRSFITPGNKDVAFSFCSSGSSERVVKVSKSGSISRRNDSICT